MSCCSVVGSGIIAVVHLGSEVKVVVVDLVESLASC